MREEIGPLVERLNELLHRLDEPFARERSLTARVAHQLRTPVADNLATAGVALSADRAPPDYREALEEVRGCVGCRHAAQPGGGTLGCALLAASSRW